MKKRIISGALAVLIAAMPITSLAVVRQYDQGEFLPEHITEGGYDAGYDPNYDANELDTQEVKYYIDEYFTFSSKSTVWFDAKYIPSGWDYRNAGGTIAGDYYSVATLKDTNEKLPMELSRRFEDAKSGELTLDFTAKFNAIMNGAAFRMYADRNVAISLEVVNGSWSLLKPDGEYMTFCPVTENTEYGVRIVFDVDKNLIKKVYVGGELYEVNTSFVTAVDRVNCFAVNTGEGAMGDLVMKTVQLFRGYRLYDRFISYSNGVPAGNEKSEVSAVLPEDYVVKNGSAALVFAKENSFPDDWSLSLKKNTGVEKKFDPISGKIEYGFHVIMPDAADETEIGINSGESNVISFYTQGGKIGYKTQAAQNTVYDYMPNVWYYLKFIVDLDNNTADMYVNNRLMGEDIALGSHASADTFVLSTGAVKDVVRADDLYVQPFVEEPADYVPEPQPVSSGDYKIGMQFCPMMVNGHHVGWDSISYDKNRLPYLGYYDENNPETIDWMIKQMVEHGMSFARVTWCMQPDNANPVNKPFFGYSWLNAYQQSKYKDMIDYMLIWENGTMGSSAEKLVNSVGPYWIEHYFKDPNYLKIDGRPVVSFLGTDVFVNGSGSVEAAAEGIAKFREMCIEAGVGDPIITTGSWNETDEAVGFDGTASYFATSGDQIAGIKGRYNSFNGVTNYMVPVSMGLDGTVWGSTTLGWDTPEEFEEMLVYARDEFMPKTDENNLFKNWLLIETYDELGEGHFPSPTGLSGFSYFDSIRKVFAEDTEHEDIVPTMAQKDRFNNLYPYGRNVGQLDRPAAPVRDPEDMEVAASWKFGGDSLAGWTYANANLDASGSTLKMTTKVDAQLILNNANIDLKAIPYVRVRARYSSTDSYLQMFFQTAENPGFTEKKAALLSLVPDYAESGLHDILVDMSVMADWNGTLTHLRFDPTSKSDVEVEIESIELLYDPEMAAALDAEEAAKPITYECTMGDQVYQFERKPYDLGYHKYVAVRDVAEALGYVVDYDYFNHDANIIVGEDIYRLDFETNKVFDGDWEEIPPLAYSYVCVDGVTYVDSEFTEYVSGLSYSLAPYGEGTGEESTETLIVSDTSLLWNFNSNEGDNAWVPSTSMGDVEINNSWLVARIAGYYPMLQAKLPQTIDASRIKGIAIGVANETGCEKARLRFSGKDGVWTQDHTFEFNINPDTPEMTEYYIDTSGELIRYFDTGDGTTDGFLNTNANVNFSGPISNLRFEFDDAQGTIGVDYIRVDLNDVSE